MSAVRENWRVALLVVAVVVSLFLLVGPPLGDDAANETAAPNGSEVVQQERGMTNLNYGLELSGGTRIQAPLVGWTAEDVEFGDRDTGDVESAVASHIENATTRDVVLVPPQEGESATWALEVRADTDRSEVQQALEEEGVSYSSVRPGMTSQTRNEVVSVLQDKIDETGIAGGRVRTIYSVSEGRHFAVVELPNANESEVRSLIEDPGTVRVYAYHEAENGSYTNRTVLTNDDFQRVGLPQLEQNRSYVPVSIEDGVAPQFQRDMVETGIAREHTTSCGWPGENGPCMLIVRDGEVVGSFGMRGQLGSSMLEGSWQNDPEFILPTGNYSQARDLSVDLRAGELPTGLALDQGSTQFVSATFGQSARINAVITAIISIFAVTGVVFLRYGDVRVALPMVLTALSEVLLLLGFASSVGLALDLSHIAGFIAVIGTGVDDLVIIADDILQKGKITTDRVFKNRFRKALWIIGAAAATTIIAMSPLAVLGLQQLRGFAIVTIVGVLLGVLVTRPAYGDILRYLMMDEE